MFNLRVFLRIVLAFSLSVAGFSSLAWGACGTVVSNTVTCSNTAAISAATGSQANVFPSTITIPAGTLSGAVSKVTLAVSGISQSAGNDDLIGAELLLLAPDGSTKLVVLTSAGDGFSAPNSTLTIDDAAPAYDCTSGAALPASLPATACSGLIAPPNGFPGVCTASPASCPMAQPTGTGASATLSVFNTVSNANGDWKLYVVDNGGGAGFTFGGGWSITITTSGAASAPTTTTVAANPTTVLRTPPGPSDPTTVTASVTSSSAVNGGTVSFSDNGSPVSCGTGSSTTVANGTATCILTFGVEGVHLIRATYGGTASFSPSTSTSPASVTVIDRTAATGITATAGTFCNQGVVAIPATGTAFGAGSPYPSQIFVGSNGAPNLPGVITGLTIDLKGIQHTNPNSPSLLLVSPGGTPYVLLSDVYTSAGSQGPANITLSDAAGAALPNSGGFTSGTFRPADYHVSANQDQGVFPAPAPQTGFQFPAPLGTLQPSGPITLGQAFNGGPASGAWQLFALNDAGGSGSISGGWCLNFTVNPNAAGTTTTVTASPAASYTSAPFSAKFPPAPANDFVTFTSHTASATTGQVTFSDDGVNLTCTNGTVNPAPVDGSGNATCSTTFAAEGNHIIRASFHDASTAFGDSSGTTLERVDSHSTKSVNLGTYTYCNPSQIRIPGTGLAAAPANPYPSNIFIGDLPGSISHVSLTIPGLNVPTGSVIRDMTSMLVGPNQTITDSLDLFSHVGLNSGLAISANITLDDNAALNLTQSSNPTTGNWKPTSFGAPTYPTLAPAGPYPPPAGTPQYASPSGTFTFTGVYGGGPGNTRGGDGTWSLFQQTTANGDNITEGNGTTIPGWCLSFTVNPPVLSIAKSDGGAHFRQGQTGAQYALTVTNHGPGPTGGTTTVTDTLPAGLTFVNGTGTDWSCNAAAQTVTCNNSDAVAQNANFPVLTLSVNVANNAPTPLSNQASVSGGGASGGATSNTTSTVVDQAADLTIAKSHTGNFRQGDTGDTYSIVVTNSGAGATIGAVTAADTLPSGLTATAISGTGWTCTLGTLSCTRTDALAPAASYPAITLTVNVAQNAPASVSNTATVSGGGEFNTANDTATDPTTIVPAPDLTIAKTHSGNFRQGDTGDTYSITVSNSGGGPTAGTVSVVDSLPSGLTATAISGTGWTCTLGTLTCTRSDVLNTASSYPAITVSVNVANNAPASLANSATVSGGGEFNTANDTATDPTTIVQAADLTITKSHIGSFRQGDTADTYTIVINNAGPGPTTGTVTMTDTLPAGLTATAISGTGWTCTLGTLTCSRSDVLAAGSSYPAITLTVSVANNAPASVTNAATVSGGGELNTANDSSSDPTTVIQTADLTIAKSHTGNFTVGDAADNYTLTVSNAGPGPTTGTVTVTDTLPTGLTATAISGTGWSCTLGTLTCTRTDVLAAGSSYPAITLTVSVATNAASTLTNTAAVSGGGELNTANDSASDATTIVQTIAVTVQTSPTGLSLTVDNTTYTSTQTFQWVPGSPHTIATTSPQSGGAGVQFVWLNWSDGGAISHSVTGPSSPTTYTANFQQQFLLTTAVNPAGGGTVTGSGFYNAGATATVTATANAGYTFVSFTGTTSPASQNPGSVLMDAPKTVTANFVIPTTTVAGAASGQYSDSVTLTATVTPTSVGSQLLGGTVNFTVNGSPAGSAPVNASGVASVAYTIPLGAGTYAIVAQFISSNPAFANSAGNNTLTVTRENATVTPSATNPFSVQVNAPGGTAGPITLSASIVETADGSAGDISNAVPVTCTLSPVVTATALTATATVTGGGVGGTLTATCTFNNVAVNVYDVTFSVGGNFYTGTSPVTVLAIFDPTSGFTTGGGTLTHNTAGANFGFNVKYQANGSVDGSLDYVEHRSSGDVHLKGTTVQSLSIVGNTAVFLVQVTLNGVAGYTAQVTAADVAEPGKNQDTFGLQVTGPNNTAVPDLTFSPITIDGGNIQVHN